MKRLFTILATLALVVSACGDTATTEVTATSPVAANTDDTASTTTPPDGTAAADDGEATLADYLPFFSGPEDPAEAEAFYREQERQAQESVATCMAEQGFEYIPFVYEGQYEDPFFDESLSEEERIAEQGFGMAYWLLNQDQFTIEYDEEDNPDPNWEIEQAMSDAEREAYYYALHGEQPDESAYEDFNFETATEEELMAFEEEMQRLWEEREWKGCFDLAYSELYGDGGDDDIWGSFEQEFGDPWRDIDLRVQADPRVIEWRQEWASCMSSAGYSFTDQEDMYQTLDAEMQTIVDWGDDVGFVQGPEPIMDEDGNPVENEDGSYTFVDQDGNIYTQQEVDEFYNELYGPKFDEAELIEFQEREIAVALADYACGNDFWEKFGEIFEEYQNEWVAENKAALDAWKAAREAQG